jgi:hypothetical protein
MMIFMELTAGLSSATALGSTAQLSTARSMMNPSARVAISPASTPTSTPTMVPVFLLGVSRSMPTAPKKSTSVTSSGSHHCMPSPLVNPSCRWRNARVVNVAIRMKNAARTTLSMTARCLAAASAGCRLKLGSLDFGGVSTDQVYGGGCPGGSPAVAIGDPRATPHDQRFGECEAIGPLTGRSLTSMPRPSDRRPGPVHGWPVNLVRA